MTGTSLASSFSGDVLFQSIKDQFKSFPDNREPSRVDIPIEDFLMSGLALFLLKFPSLLQFENEVRNNQTFSNMKSLFGISRVPSDTHLLTMVDEFLPELFRPLFNSLFLKAQRAKVLESFSIFSNTYCLSVDGTGYYYSDNIKCACCLEKKSKSKDEKSFYHHMLCGAIVHPDQKEVIPLCPEPISMQDGSNKNDCEQNAMKRFLTKFREDHPKLKTILLADALHSNIPTLDLLKKLDINFVLSVKPGSHEKLFAGLDRRESTGEVNHFEEEFDIGDKIKKKKTCQYRFTNGILLNNQSTTQSVNFLEYWETIQWVDKNGEIQEDRKHFSWITDYSLYSSSCKQIVRAGRTRWKIENETFNALKNQGYEFEHNFGHGYKNLSTNFAMLMMLAFFIDQLQELKCPTFRKALHKSFNKKSRLWVKMRAAYELVPIQFESWIQFLDFFADKSKWTVIVTESG